MISIRKIYDFLSPSNQSATIQCKELLVAQFPYLSLKEADVMFEQIKSPLAVHFRYELFVAENKKKMFLV